MTLEEAKVALEAGFKIVPQGDSRLAPTGEPYVEVCSGSVKYDDEQLPCFCATPEIAISLWLHSAVAYAGLPEEGKTLYWRITPELGSFHVLRVEPDGSVLSDADMRRAMTHKVYAVYSRFLVSNQPALADIAA